MLTKSVSITLVPSDSEVDDMIRAIVHAVMKGDMTASATACNVVRDLFETQRGETTGTCIDDNGHVTAEPRKWCASRKPLPTSCRYADG
jgi:hypothetical protein